MSVFLSPALARPWIWVSVLSDGRMGSSLFIWYRLSFSDEIYRDTEVYGFISPGKWTKGDKCTGSNTQALTYASSKPLRFGRCRQKLYMTVYSDISSISPLHTSSPCMYNVGPETCSMSLSQTGCPHRMTLQAISNYATYPTFHKRHRISLTLQAHLPRLPQSHNTHSTSKQHTRKLKPKRNTVPFHKRSRRFFIRITRFPRHVGGHDSHDGDSQ